MSAPILFRRKSALCIQFPLVHYLVGDTAALISQWASTAREHDRLTSNGSARMRDENDRYQNSRMRPPPLLGHLIFHPDSVQARRLAVALHRSFNCDPLLPGLRVPTVMLSEDGSGLPPLSHDLDEAQHSIAIVLSDDFMLVSGSQEGRVSWPDFVLNISKLCSGAKHRFLPVQRHKCRAWS